jgi:predicted metal-dependent enzyme (double-stranded beta helix superfamily)
VTATAPSTPQADEFIRQIVDAAALNEHDEICQSVKTILKDLVTRGLDGIPDQFLQGTPGTYARRMLHQCPDKTHTVIVMVWQPGQSTPIHDHAGSWCVECVLKGNIEITGFDPVGDPATGCRFEEIKRTRAEPGNVGILVPPDEYHSIANVSQEEAVTIHVYEGEMLWCHAFDEKENGTYSRRKNDLSYTE